MSDVISGRLLGHPGPEPKLLDGSISIMFLLETRLQSESLAQQLGPRPGNMSQNDLKTTSLMMSL